MVLGYSGNPDLASMGNTILLGTLLLVIFDVFLMRRRMKKELERRFPGESTKGIAYYSITRSMQMKFMRMPKAQAAGLLTGALAAGLFPVALNVSAQEAPVAQEKGPAPADAMLHALTVTYPTPYRAMETAEVKAVLDRVFGYLDRTTPAELISKSSGAAVTDLSRADPDAVLKPGDFRLTSYEWGVTYLGMLAAGAATGDQRYTDYTVKRHQLLSQLTKTYYPALNWALDGHGLLLRAEWDIAKYLRSGRLQIVLEDYTTPPADIHAIYPEKHKLSPKVKLFVEFLAASFQGQAGTRPASAW
eukprot:gene29607-33431_t